MFDLAAAQYPTCIFPITIKSSHECNLSPPIYTLTTLPSVPTMLPVTSAQSIPICTGTNLTSHFQGSSDPILFSLIYSKHIFPSSGEQGLIYTFLISPSQHDFFPVMREALIGALNTGGIVLLFLYASFTFQYIFKVQYQNWPQERYMVCLLCFSGQLPTTIVLRTHHAISYFLQKKQRQHEQPVSSHKIMSKAGSVLGGREREGNNIPSCQENDS